MGDDSGHGARKASCETALLGHPKVSDCAVVDAGDGSDALIAYVDWSGDEAWAEIATELAARTDSSATHVIVNAVPRRPDGAPDLDRLAAIPALNEQLIDAASEQVECDYSESAVVVEARQYSVPPVHIGHLDTNRRPVTHRAESPGHSPAGNDSEVVRAGTPAISHGGPIIEGDEAPRTLTDCLTSSARYHADRGILCQHPDGREDFLAYGHLIRAASQVLARLRELGVSEGDPVIFQLPDAMDFMRVFWACQLGGFVPVPMPPVDDFSPESSSLNKVRQVTAGLPGATIISAGATAAAFSELEDRGQMRSDSIDGWVGLAPATEFSSRSPDEPALFLLTSGSTGVPKIVPLSHRNLLAMSLGTVQMNGFSPGDVALNWMPLDHVGACVFLHTMCMFLGCNQVHVPKEFVLEDMGRWLDLITKHRATISWAPNFAFRLIIDRLKRSGTGSWDLSSMGFLVNAGEMITASTAREFLQVLSEFGLPEDALHPAFGMSETCSGITWSDRFSLAHTSDDIKSVELGPPIPGASLRIVDDDGITLSEGEVGRLQLCGPSVTAGYLDNPTANAESFTQDGWFDTGDSGLLLDGRLTLTGRTKEAIIVRGINYDAHEIEAAIERVPGVLPSYAAASPAAPRNGADEALAVFFCAKSNDDETLRRLLLEIQAALLSTCGSSADYLLPLQPEQIPKTEIGKIQRRQLRQRLEQGEFQAALQRADLLLENRWTLPGWFYNQAWRVKPAASWGTSSDDREAWLVFSDHRGLADTMIGRLRADGCKVYPVLATSGPGQSNDALSTVLDLQDAKACREWARAFDEDLRSAGCRLRYVLYCASYDDSFVSPAASAQPDGAAVATARLLQTLQMLDRLKTIDEAALITVVTAALNQVGEVSPQPGQFSAPLPALLSTWEAENPRWRTSSVDLHGEALKPDIAALDKELAGAAAEPRVAWRAGLRYVPELVTCSRSAADARSEFANGGAYLLTGGLGGIGFSLAERLLTDYAARLLVVGRSAEDDVGQRLDALRRLAGEIVYAQVDVSDATALESAVLAWETRLGSPLLGALHLAGSFSGSCRLTDESAETIAEIYPAKVQGTSSVAALLAGRPNAWAVCFGSASSLLGYAGMGVYAAANAVQAHLCAAYRNTSGQDIRYLGWSLWDGLGMGATLDATARGAIAAAGFRPISMLEGWRSLRLARQLGRDAIYAGLDTSRPRLQRMMYREDPSRFELVAYVAGENTDLPPAWLDVSSMGRAPYRCPLVTLRRMPRTDGGQIDRDALSSGRYRSGDLPDTTDVPETLLNELEGLLRGVLKESPGATQILDHPLSNLGVDSLSATELARQIDAATGVAVPLSLLLSGVSLRMIGARLVVEGYTSAECEAYESDATPQLVGRGAIESPLSFAQHRLWFQYQLAPNDPFYNVALNVQLSGTLDVAALEQSLLALVERQTMLRTAYKRRAGDAVQYCLPAPSHFELPVVDLSQLDSAAQDAAVREHLDKEVLRPFDLEAGQVFRVSLLKLDERQHLLVFPVHHIAFDGWSVTVLLDELRQAYLSACSGINPPPAPLSVQYADFAVWQREWLAGQRESELLDYWKSQLRGSHTLDLPADRPRPAAQTYAGASAYLTLPPTVAAGLRSLGQQHGTTLFVVLLAAFKVLLYRYTGQEDLSVGSPIANRRSPELHGLIGFFVNMLVMRTQPTGELRFDEYLEHVRDTTYAAYEHQDLPFERLVQELDPDRDPSRSPLFQICFALQNASTLESSFGDVDARVIALDAPVTRFDMEVHVWEVPEGLKVQALHNAHLFDLARIERMLAHYANILSAVLDEPGQVLSAINLLSPAETRELLVDFNVTGADYPREASIVDRFEHHVQLSPAATAVEFGETRISYAELDEGSSRLATLLVSRGVKASSVVGVCLERGVDFITSVLAILKAGAMYLPLDPDYPQDRLRFMLEDAAAALVITQQAHSGVLPVEQSALVLLDSSAEAIRRQPIGPGHRRSAPTDAAYVIYTSGSTGRPKGVVVTHRNVVSLVTNVDYVALDPSSIFLLMAPASFDASTFELWGPLLNGGRLAIAPPGRLSVEQLASAVATYRVNTMFLTTALFNAVVDTRLAEFTSLQWLLFGGEAHSIDHVRRAAAGLPATQIVHVYGPTETTTFATAFPVPDGPAESLHTIPIGRPITNKKAYVLDQSGLPVPLGVPGELYVGGDGVASGYHGLPGLTDERFLDNPFANGSSTCLYRTGDLVRWSAKGQIEFIGRRDRQIKLRGFRIELGEVEALLASHAEVGAVVADLWCPSGDEKHLVAYIVPACPDAPQQESRPGQVDQWQRLYEDLYAGGVAVDRRRDFTGWNSSYTGEAIPEDHMVEWLDATVDRIRALEPDKVLEIGCGSGLLLFELAGRCSRYAATDFSGVALQGIREALEAGDDAWPQLELHERLATDFTDFERESFDLVVINSVSQYLPDGEQLAQILAGAVSRVADGGRVFVGDVRNFDLLLEYHASVQAYRADPTVDRRDLWSAVQRQAEEEAELLVSPEFFRRVASSLPRVSAVEVMLKRGHAQTEMNKFRYDVVLTVGDIAAEPAPSHWHAAVSLGLQGIEALLGEGPASLGVTGIPNARLMDDCALLDWLEADAPAAMLTDYRNGQGLEAAAEQGAPPAIDPEDLWALADRLGYRLQLRYSAERGPGYVDGLFRRMTETPAVFWPMPEAQEAALEECMNDPGLRERERLLRQRLRDHAREVMPEHMWPSVIMLMPVLPLDPNGKIDRRALPPPVPQDSGQAYVAPSSPIEGMLSEIWSEALGIDRVGMRDNFFELGGHSLAATRVVSRIHDEFAVELPLSDFFDDPTIAAVAAAVDEQLIARVSDMTEAEAAQLVERLS